MTYTPIRTRAAYAPLMICDHGKAGTVSFHRSSLAAHLYWHTSLARPCQPRLATREEHEQAGWDVSEYPGWIS